MFIISHHITFHMVFKAVFVNSQTFWFVIAGRKTICLVESGCFQG